MIEELPAFDTTMKQSIHITLVLLFTSFTVLSAADKAQRPNVLIIYADDLGYGDLGCYNRESKIPTPNIDKLAKEGMRFTDAHSPATVCTPSRYSLRTGQLAFRAGVAQGALVKQTPISANLVMFGICTVVSFVSLQ